MAHPPETAARRPNVIWVFGGQHRAQALGCAGDPNLRTPNLDRLTAEGLWFTHAVAGAPRSRAAALTGRRFSQPAPAPQTTSPGPAPTLAAPLSEAGYHTAWFGHWGADPTPSDDRRQPIPRDRRGGFDTWLGYPRSNSPWNCWVHGHHDADEIPAYRLAGYEADDLTDLLLGHIRDRADHATAGDAPFFAALALQPPHAPYAAPEFWMRSQTPGRIRFRPNVPKVSRIRDRARRELAGANAMIENLDWNLGRIRAELRETGVDEDTHILFAAAHGDALGSHGQFGPSQPYEEAVRVPMILGGGPVHLRRGLCDCPVSHADLAPTTLELCGIAPPASMQGRSAAGYRVHADGPDPEPFDDAYLQPPNPTTDADADADPDGSDRPWRGLVTRDRWKYAALAGQPWLMFNLAEDPNERVNLAHHAAYRHERDRLNQRLAAWVDHAADDFPVPEL